jgi:hypothetical protein
MSPKIEWKAEGDYFEACNCRSVCLCNLYWGDPDEGECKVSVAWHIDKGHYGSTTLDGLNVVGAFYAPGNMATGPKWQAALYLDERATKEQAAALGAIFGGQAGGVPGAIAAFIGEVKGVRSVPIAFTIDGRKRRLSIPSTLELGIEALAGADPQRVSTVTNIAFTVGAGFDPVIARSTQHTYKDFGLEWNNSGKNGFYSRFAYAP